MSWNQYAVTKVHLLPRRRTLTNTLINSHRFCSVFVLLCVADVDGGERLHGDLASLGPARLSASVRLT